MHAKGLRAALSRRASPRCKGDKSWTLQVKLNRLLTSGRMRAGCQEGWHAAPPFKRSSFWTAKKAELPPGPTAV